MTTISNRKCQEEWKTKTIIKSHLCTKARGIGVCHGDYGSPLALNGELIGLAVFSLCTNGNSDGFTRISHYKNWINVIIKNNS